MLVLHVEGTFAEADEVEESSIEFGTDKDHTQTDKANAFIVQV